MSPDVFRQYWHNSKMKSYILKRILFLLPMIIIVTFLVFLLTSHSPEHQALVLLKAQGVDHFTQDLIDKTIVDYGFDRPVVIRYVNWLLNALRLDFGNSYILKKPVIEVVASAFRYTLVLGLITAAISLVFSLLLGVLCALSEGGFFDLGTRLFMFVLAALPAYLLGIILMWVFSVRLRILPTSGAGTVKHLVMPVIALGAPYVGFYTRVVRTNMLASMNEQYVSFLKSCGISRGKIIRHELRNSLQTFITAYTIAIIQMIAGTFIVETIFSWPGLGRLCIDSIFGNDIPVIQAYVLMMAVFYCLFNIASDILNAFMNPRLRGE